MLIAGAKTKFFHLKEFGEALRKIGVEYKLVHDIDIYTGFPSKNILHWFQSRKKFNELVDEFKPDAVFVDRQTHFCLATLDVNIPLFVLLRGDYWSEIEWAKETLYKFPLERAALWWKQRIANRCFSEATVILPICKYLEKIVKAKYPMKSTEVLYQGIDPSRWYPVRGMNLKHPSVGFLQSATIWGKTKEMLTLEKVIKAMPNVTFYWGGDGPYRKNVLEKLGGYSNFKWLGALQYPDEVRQYLTSIDVYALASGMDMSPLTLQEAQLMEKPVVATNVGGIPELMNDKVTGFLVEKGDYEGWVEKLTILVNDHKKTTEMGREGRKFIENNFNWDIIAKTFLKILESNLK